MGNKHKQIIYFCEGETEENLLVSLKEEQITAGELKKFNLWQYTRNTTYCFLFRHSVRWRPKLQTQQLIR